MSLCPRHLPQTSWPSLGTSWVTVWVVSRGAARLGQGEAAWEGVKQQGRSERGRGGWAATSAQRPVPFPDQATRAGQVSQKSRCVSWEVGTCCSGEEPGPGVPSRPPCHLL